MINRLELVTDDSQAIIDSDPIMKNKYNTINTLVHLEYKHYTIITQYASLSVSINF